MQRRLKGGEWDGVGPPAGAQEGLQEAGGVCREEPVSVRLTGALPTDREVPVVAAPLKPRGRAWMGTTESMLRWWPWLITGNGDREVGSGNFLLCVQLSRVGSGGLGRRSGREGLGLCRVGLRVGWRHPACMAW